MAVKKTTAQLEEERRREKKRRRRQAALILTGLLLLPRTPQRINSSITFDEASSRYRGPDGRFVSRQVVRRESQKVAAATSRRLVDLSEEFKAGKISRSDWLIRFRNELKAGHSLNYILARGGRDAMTPADWGRVGQLLQTQYDALGRFALQLSSGKPMNLGRVKMYANAIRLTYENALTRLALDRNPDQLARWVRTANESCPGCLEQESRGVLPADEFPPRGTQHCLANCHCILKLVVWDTTRH